MADYLANLLKDLPYVLKEALVKNGHIEILIFSLTKISQERFMKPFLRFLGTFQAVQYKEQVKIN